MKLFFSLIASLVLSIAVDAAVPTNQKINVQLELQRLAKDTPARLSQNISLTAGKVVSIKGTSVTNKNIVMQLTASVPDKSKPNDILVSTRIYEYVNGKPILISSPQMTVVNGKEAQIESMDNDKIKGIVLKVKPTLTKTQ